MPWSSTASWSPAPEESRARHGPEHPRHLGALPRCRLLPAARRPADRRRRGGALLAPQARSGLALAGLPLLPRAGWPPPVRGGLRRLLRKSAQEAVAADLDGPPPRGPRRQRGEGPRPPARDRRAGGARDPPAARLCRPPGDLRPSPEP